MFKLKKKIEINKEKIINLQYNIIESNAYKLTYEMTKNASFFRFGTFSTTNIISNNSLKPVLEHSKLLAITFQYTKQLYTQKKRNHYKKKTELNYSVNKQYKKINPDE